MCVCEREMGLESPYSPLILSSSTPVLVASFLLVLVGYLWYRSVQTTLTVKCSTDQVMPSILRIARSVACAYSDWHYD